MTIGDFVMYLTLTALITVPIVQLASIGTQMTEAFAGLDRIREIRRMATEDDEDASRLPMPEVRGEVAFRDVTFEYNEGTPVLKAVSFHAPAGSTTALVGIERLGQEHADQPGDDVQPPEDRTGARRRARSDRRPPARLSQSSRRRAAGQLPLRRHDRREHRLREAARDARRDRGASAASRTATSSSRGSRRATTPSSASAASGCRAASGSASRSRGRFWPTRGS